MRWSRILKFMVTTLLLLLGKSLGSLYHLYALQPSVIVKLI